jgi:mannose-6-phosphate isomerase-like protein (cupin superfamily)
MHPDADELLFLLSGRIRLRLELVDGDREVEVVAGQAVVVLRGTWHQIYGDEPGQLLNVTPGPVVRRAPARSLDAEPSPRAAQQILNDRADRPESDHLSQ